MAFSYTGSPIVTNFSDYTILRFESSGDITLDGEHRVEALVVGGGGSGGQFGGGGGGGGGVALADKTLSAGTYSVTVGLGGAEPTSNPSDGFPGGDSIFSDSGTDLVRGTGGLGGGSGSGGAPGGASGQGLVDGQVVNASNPGDNASNTGGGGGGAGFPASGGGGGDGLSLGDFTDGYLFGGGASGETSGGSTNYSGADGGGDAKVAGAANSGGGGGGSWDYNGGAAGGSGVVVLKVYNAKSKSTVSGTVQVDGQPVSRKVRAFSYRDESQTIGEETHLLSKTLGQAVSDEVTGEYSIDLLGAYDREIFVVAFDDYGDDFTPDKAISVRERIHPTTPDGHVYECTGSGTLPSEEPDWIVDTETSQLYGTASMIARVFYRPMVHGPVAPEVTTNVTLWTPEQITSNLWLDADATDTVVTDGSGNVTSWKDRSGSARDATTDGGTITLQPGYLDFSAAAMTLPSLGVSGSAPRTVFIVADMPNDQTTGLFTIYTDKFDTGQRWSFRQAGSGTKLRMEIEGSGYTSAFDCLGLGIYACTFEGTDLSGHTLWKDGTPEVATGTSAVNTTDSINTLGRANAASDSITAKFHEVLFLPENPTQEVRQKIEGYLAHKWGLEANLPSDHPYKSSAPVVDTSWTPVNLFANNESGAWYDPSDLSTMFQDTAGTVPVTADGDPVGLFQDKSGNGVHLQQGTEGARPIYKTDGTLHWLEGDGSGHFMSSDPLPLKLLEDGGFAAAAWYSDLDQEVAGVIEEVSTTSSDQRILIYADTRSDPKRLFNYSPGSTSTLVDVLTKNDPLTPYISVFNSNGTTAWGRKNAVDQGSIASSATFNSGETRLTILKRTLGPLTLAGRFYGAVVVDRYQVDEDRDKVEQYLAEKAGVNL